MAGAELSELFKKAQSAAEKATLDGSEADEERCLDALRTMRSLSVTTAVLQSTQVGKQLRKLTKHSRSTIRSLATDVLEDWKNVVALEAKSKKSNGKLDTKGKVAVVAGSGTPLKNGTTAPGVVVVKRRPLPKCNDATRDKMREMLLDAFEKVIRDADPEYIDEVNAKDPVEVAVDVETVLHTKLKAADKKAKSRSILFNLRDANNPDFRRRVLLGEIPAVRLTTISAEEMASDQRKRENKQIKDKALFECERGMKQEATTNEFKCGKCGKRECTYYQKQIRSADEPMTTFVTCVNCNNRWKFC